MSNVITAESFAGLKIVKPQLRIPTINVLIYGESSVGKTTLAGGADAVPEMRKVLFVDIEKGDLALRKTPYRPDVVRISNWTQLMNLHAALLADVGNPDARYKTVVIDSLNEANDLCIKEIMASEPEGEFTTPEWKHWNQNQVRMLRMLRLFRDLPMNVIFTSLVKQQVNEKSGATKLLPDLPGKLAGKVPAIFDNVLYYYMKEFIEDKGGEKKKVNKRLLMTTMTPTIIAKNRGSDNLPQIIQVPPTSEAVTMKLIYEGILGGESK